MKAVVRLRDVGLWRGIHPSNLPIHPSTYPTYPSIHPPIYLSTFYPSKGRRARRAFEATWERSQGQIARKVHKLTLLKQGAHSILFRLSFSGPTHKPHQVKANKYAMSFNFDFFRFQEKGPTANGPNLRNRDLRQSPHLTCSARALRVLDERRRSWNVLSLGACCPRRPTNHLR